MIEAQSPTFAHGAIDTGGKGVAVAVAVTVGVIVLVGVFVLIRFCIPWGRDEQPATSKRTKHKMMDDVILMD